jgi:hypothetical protein
MVYGSLTRGLELADLTSNIDIDNFQGYVDGLTLKLRQLKIHLLPSQNNTSGLDTVDHTRCFKTDMEKKVSWILEGVGNPAVYSRYRHMKVQKAKLRGTLENLPEFRRILATWLAYKFTHLKLEVSLHLGEEITRKVDGKNLPSSNSGSKVKRILTVSTTFH